MIRAILVLAVPALVACGDNAQGPLTYTNPTPCTAMCLIRAGTPTASSITLAWVVGDEALTGYSTGFDLPIDVSKVQLAAFTPGSALPAGDSSSAAAATIVTSGVLAGDLVVAQSQKASGAGAVTTDAVLAAHTVLLTFQLDLAGTTNGIVFDGTAQDFHLPSGGLRNRAGLTVVTSDQVAIGKLEVKR
ncbi:hypothetical protein BH11MYX1_BH11MYX1_20240 [soil metagenome]